MKIMNAAYSHIRKFLSFASEQSQRCDFNLYPRSSLRSSDTFHAMNRACPCAPLNNLSISRLNAGMSSGLRLDTRLLSTTTS